MTRSSRSAPKCSGPGTPGAMGYFKASRLVLAVDYTLVGGVEVLRTVPTGQGGPDRIRQLSGSRSRDLGRDSAME